MTPARAPAAASAPAAGGASAWMRGSAVRRRRERRAGAASACDRVRRRQHQTPAGARPSLRPLAPGRPRFKPIRFIGAARAVGDASRASRASSSACIVRPRPAHLVGGGEHDALRAMCRVSPPNRAHDVDAAGALCSTCRSKPPPCHTLSACSSSSRPRTRTAARARARSARPSCRARRARRRRRRWWRRRGALAALAAGGDGRPPPTVAPVGRAARSLDASARRPGPSLRRQLAAYTASSRCRPRCTSRPLPLGPPRFTSIAVTSVSTPCGAARREPPRGDRERREAGRGG